MSRTIRQCIRGTQGLPGVGRHPGTYWMLMFAVMGLVLGVERGALGAVIGALGFPCVFSPLYLYGAYERAEMSDRIVRFQEQPDDTGEQR